MSVRRFVNVNQENIGRSSKEKIASASYSGGMIDMIMVVKSALGSWGVGQLLDELERWSRKVPPDAGPQVHVSVNGAPGQEGLTPEDARELGEKVARWMEERRANGRRQGKDPMFA